MTVNEIIQLVCLVIPLLGTLVGFLISLIKSIKAGKFGELKKVILEYVKKAEENTEMNGSEKKQFVIDNVIDFCKKINFKFNYELVSQIIESIIDLSKQINYKQNNIIEEEKDTIAMEKKISVLEEESKIGKE